MDDEIKQAFLGVVELINRHNQHIKQMRCSLMAVKAALSTSFPDPGLALAEIDRLEKECLDGDPFSEDQKQVDAMLLILKSGKRPDKLDS